MKNGFVKVAVANPEIQVANVDFNKVQILKLVAKALENNVQMLVLPELCVTGYTCGDLFFQQTLIKSAEKAVIEIAKQVPSKMILIFGAPIEFRGKIHNCAVIANNGRILGLVPKINIPNYKEFYECRYFTPALEHPETILLGNERVLLSSKLIFTCNQMASFRFACEICEDLWVPNPPSVDHAINGATVIANLSASDEFVGKSDYRSELVRGQSARLICGYLYADAGEGESTSDLVYIGNNMICENGITLCEKSQCADSLLITELDLFRIEHERNMRNTFVTTNDSSYIYIPFDMEIMDVCLSRDVDPYPFIPDDKKDREKRCEEIVTLQALGLKKRISVINAKSAVIGLSGGLDSTLALLVVNETWKMLKKDPNDIVCISMPCFGTTKRTKNNAEILANRLGVTLRTIDIFKAVNQHFEDIGHDPSIMDVVYENSQARERTQILMDVSNQTKGIVIGTGDLSELALGWATYNGDHMSMYGINSSVPKTLVRSLVKYFARKSDDNELKLVLDDILSTPISPELIPGQETEKTVGSYDLNDFFLYEVMRWGSDPSKVYRLAKKAFKGKFEDKEILDNLKTFYWRFFTQQFKRSCLPDGPKIGSIAISPRGDWRMPSDASVQIWKRELDEMEY